MGATMLATLRSIEVLSTLAVALSVLAVPLSALAVGGERLVFSDDFEVLDHAQWIPMVSAWRGGNSEFQYYRNDTRNSYVRDGILYLLPTLTADEFGEDLLYHGSLSYPDCNKAPCVSQAGDEIVLPVQSARLSSRFTFKYGRLEVRARLPEGDWLWPAIWLYPRAEAYGPWPRGGEIDLMESRGNAHLVDGLGRDCGVRTVGSAVHFGPAWNSVSSQTFRRTAGNGTLADGFHVYTLEWSEDGLRFLLDGLVIGERPRPDGGFWSLGGFRGENIWKGGRMAPFDQEFFIIMNVAVGGTFFGDLVNSPHPRPYDLSSGRAMRQFWERRAWWRGSWHGERAALQVDYVRVYQA